MTCTVRPTYFLSRLSALSRSKSKFCSSRVTGSWPVGLAQQGRLGADLGRDVAPGQPVLALGQAEAAQVLHQGQVVVVDGDGQGLLGAGVDALFGRRFGLGLGRNLGGGLGGHGRSCGGGQHAAQDGQREAGPGLEALGGWGHGLGRL